MGARITGREKGLKAVCKQSGSGVIGTGKGEGRPGVNGTSESHNGVGIKGEAHDGASAFGVRARSQEGYAGFFDGNVHITGDFEVEGQPQERRVPDGGRDAPA
ncbi:hypothetical protein [Streptomyces sp. NPDC055287]